MQLYSIYRQLELAYASLDHAIYYLEIDATEHAIQHLQFARQQLESLPKPFQC